MTIDQNSSNSIILKMYSSLLLGLMTYSKHLNLGAHNISLGIHFFIDALILGLVSFPLSRNWIKWCIAKSFFIGINVIIHTITSNHLLHFVNSIASIISDLCCMHHTSILPCVFFIINFCMFSSNVLNFSLQLPHSSNYGVFLGVYKYFWKFHP